MGRQNVHSKNQWEEKIGYSRAVKKNGFIIVSGTTAVDDDSKVVGVDDPYLQTKFILGKITRYLSEAGATLEDVVQTRIYVTQMDHWEKIGQAHGEFFGRIRPAATMVEVSSLILPELLVEIEVVAILSR